MTMTAVVHTVNTLNLQESLGVRHRRHHRLLRPSLVSQAAEQWQAKAIREQL